MYIPEADFKMTEEWAMTMESVTLQIDVKVLVFREDQTQVLLSCLIYSSASSGPFPSAGKQALLLPIYKKVPLLAPKSLLYFYNKILNGITYPPLSFCSNVSYQ